MSKEIQPNEEVWMRMKYPSKRGMTEIKAFLHQEAQFVCMDCFEKTKNESNADVLFSKY
ncbi:Fe3+ hydroxamate ABC transporter substrate-binding protein [Priestia megaterium]|uniref:Fe3+ hydroxamate ABC transporter substrate-binding protein n=1 Tax=Priestia megaterium TaxID=1404 RepID=UPI00355BB15E